MSCFNDLQWLLPELTTMISQHVRPLAAWVLDIAPTNCKMRCKPSLCHSSNRRISLERTGLDGAAPAGAGTWRSGRWMVSGWSLKRSQAALIRLSIARPRDDFHQDFDSSLRPVALLSDGEHRRLWRFIMELQLGSTGFSWVQLGSAATWVPSGSLWFLWSLNLNAFINAREPPSKSQGPQSQQWAGYDSQGLLTALLAMPRTKKKQTASETPAEGRAPRDGGFVDGLQLIFNEALPDTAFTLVELCSGVGVIGLSLAHAASSCKEPGGSHLLRTLSGYTG
eukprot:Skav234685  [mRNA]  locus=scaffold3643:59257:62591:- [translate_table: standard]